MSESYKVPIQSIKKIYHFIVELSFQYQDDIVR